MDRDEFYTAVLMVVGPEPSMDEILMQGLQPVLAKPLHRDSVAIGMWPNNAINWAALDGWYRMIDEACEQLEPERNFIYDEPTIVHDFVQWYKNKATCMASVDIYLKGVDT